MRRLQISAAMSRTGKDWLGEFSVAAYMETVGGTYNVAVGDLNQDGRKVVLAAEDGAGNVAVFLSTTRWK